ncbi:MAG TPA: metallophosphoesterase family protein [Sphingomicrobium sp.]|jgi:serine/threonine protein phosphatase 1|nr:metallophosphoesterase family protein [Sphingomicrobium sp.]
MFNFAPRQQGGRAGARGWRAYVVGDIHGRLDLLETLLEKIEAEIASSRARKLLIVFVGDLIDRGPNSAQVVDRLRTYSHPRVRKVFLLGNHEEVLLRILGGEADLITKWRWFGGNECLKSYGLDIDRLTGLSDENALKIIIDTIPKEHVEFLESFDDSCRFGDYLFVHAGIRPGIEVDQQRQSDLRWIREPFLFDDTDHGFVVVHGHTICQDVEMRPNRIGIDTGAYRTGVLTALAIDGTECWLVDTRTAEQEVVSC